MRHTLEAAFASWRAQHFFCTRVCAAYDGDAAFTIRIARRADCFSTPLARRQQHGTTAAAGRATIRRYLIIV